MIYTTVMRWLVVLVALPWVLACGPGQKPASQPAPRRLLPAQTTPVAVASAPPPEERRCAEAARRPSDNMNVVIEDADGELTSALLRPPADAAGQWADVLHRLSKDCAGTEVEHALPSTRVVLRTPIECRSGGQKNELVFDFVPEGGGSAVGVGGNVTAQGRALRVAARVTPAPAGKLLCAAGRIDLGTLSPAVRSQTAADAGGPEAAVALQRWLVVPFQLVGGVMGLLPLRH